MKFLKNQSISIVEQVTIKLCILSSVLFCVACMPVIEETEIAREEFIYKQAEQFFRIYEARDDWQAFLDLYHSDVLFQDIILRREYRGIDAFAAFYNWPDPKLRKHPAYTKVLVLEDLAVTDSTAAGRGFFTPFYYDGILYDDVDHMRFVIWITLNEEGLIKRQIDFIEYPPEMLNAVSQQFLQENEH